MFKLPNEYIRGKKTIWFIVRMKCLGPNFFISCLSCDGNPVVLKIEC